MTRSDVRDLGPPVANGAPEPSMTYAAAAKAATSTAQGSRGHVSDIVSLVNRARLCAEATSEVLRQLDEQSGRGNVWIHGRNAR